MEATNAIFLPSGDQAGSVATAKTRPPARDGAGSAKAARTATTPAAATTVALRRKPFISAWIITVNVPARGPQSEGWWHYSDAWQWEFLKAVLILGALSFLAAVFLVSRGILWAYAPIGITLATQLTFIAFLRDMHDPGATETGHADLWLGGFAVTGALCASIAVVIFRPSPRDLRPRRNLRHRHPR